jgi:NAD(P)-dependent dehydrogenase (short-subunit alcohol dehydrogenase family)
MRDRVVLITGSTDGIGKQTAIELAKKGAKVLIHGRDEKRGRAVLDEIKFKTKNEQIELLIADFSSLKNVHSLAEEIISKHSGLNILINNAGVFMRDRVLSADGYEMTFAVNHLAHFLLTNLLLDLLKKNSPSRIINVSSMSHSSIINFENLQGENRYSGHSAYALSKLANIMFTYKLADDLRASGVTVNCVHPGVINTKLLRDGWGSSFALGLKSGAKCSVLLASSEKLEGVTGKFFVNRIKSFRIKEHPSLAISYDKEAQTRLWEVSEQLVRFK